MKDNCLNFHSKKQLFKCYIPLNFDHQMVMTHWLVYIIWHLNSIHLLQDHHISFLKRKDIYTTYSNFYVHTKMKSLYSVTLSHHFTRMALANDFIQCSELNGSYSTYWEAEIDWWNTWISVQASWTKYDGLMKLRWK